MNWKKLLVATLLAGSFIACKKDKGSVPPPDTKNPFDGKYSLSGTMTDATDARYSSGPAREYHMITVNSTEIEMFSPELGINGRIVMNLSNMTYYAKFSVIAKVDPATNKIVSVRNGYGQPSENGRSAVLDPSGVNAYDPVTKNFKIKYWMDQTGVTGHKASFDETWTYTGPR